MGIFTSFDTFALRADDWSDYLLPSAVNECKQIVKSKSFRSIIFTSTVSFLIISIWLYFNQSKNNFGPTAFLLYSGIMDFGLIVVIPSILYQNMSAERSSGGFELLSITSITPFKLVLGKWQSGLMQLIVFGSIIFPGLIYSYLYNGVDFSSIFYSFILTIIVAQFSMLFSIFLCSSVALKANRLVNQVFATLANIVLFGILIGYKIAIFYAGSSLIQFSLRNLITYLIFLVFLLTVEGYLLAVASARLSPYSANKSTLPRIFHNLFVIEIVFLSIFDKYSVKNIAYSFITINAFINFFYLIEKDELSKKLFLVYQKNDGFLKNAFRLFFYPGKSSAYLLFICQTILLMIPSLINSAFQMDELFSYIYYVISFISCVYLCFYFFQKKYPTIKSSILYIFPIIIIFLMFFISAVVGLSTIFTVIITFVSLVISIKSIMKQNRKQESTRDFVSEERGVG